MVFTLLAQSNHTQSGEGLTPTGKRMAIIDGAAISEEDIQAAAANEIRGLTRRKAIAILSFEREEHAIYERHLANVVDNRIIAIEAKKRGTTPELFVMAELDDSKLKAPTEEAITALWKEKKAQLNLSEEAAREQIRQYLLEQQRRALYKELIVKLRAQYHAQFFLEPLRATITTQGFPTKGTASAPVTIVEFADFECPYCAQLFITLKQVEEHYGDKVRFVFRQFPLTDIHTHAQKAAEASLCAFAQNRFWELHDAMWADNHSLEIDQLKQKASLLKLDTTAFDSCLDAATFADAITKDVEEAKGLSVNATPTLFVNGRFLVGAQSYTTVAAIIDEELAK
jgi:predicted DsbA family dithiol-disulfide isomerase